MDSDTGGRRMSSALLSDRSHNRSEIRRETSARSDEQTMPNPSLPQSIFRLAQRLIRRTAKIEILNGRATYNQDGLISKHNCDFQMDPRFAKAYAAGAATGSWGQERIQWRAHIVTWAAQNGMRLDGDFVECGVNKGGMASVIREYTGIDRTSRRFWLLDTYNGLVDRHLTEGERRRGAKHWAYEECFDSVKAKFAPFPNVLLVRGEIPGTLPQVTAQQIAYLGIDLNCTEPENCGRQLLLG